MAVAATISAKREEKDWAGKGCLADALRWPSRERVVNFRLARCRLPRSIDATSPAASGRRMDALP
jgi:hypothetical protein